MLTNLEDDPLVEVVCAPYAALVLKTRTSCLGRGVDSPFVRGGELLDGALVDEGCKRLFQNGPYGPCGERPDRGSLSLERDRRGDIDGWLARHEAKANLVEETVDDSSRSMTQML